MNPNNKYRSWNIIIQINHLIESSKIEEFTKLLLIDNAIKDVFKTMHQQCMLEDYALIFHNNDNCNCHYHIVIYKFVNEKRQSTMINFLVNILNSTLTNIGFDSLFETSAISIENLVSLSSSIRYLLHLDNEDKYQYARECLECSFPINIIEPILDNKPINEKEELTTNQLISIIQDNNSYLGIIKSMGLPMFKKYCNVIKLLFEERGKCI